MPPPIGFRSTTFPTPGLDVVEVAELGGAVHPLEAVDEQGAVLVPEGGVEHEERAPLERDRGQGHVPDHLVFPVPGQDLVGGLDSNVGPSAGEEGPVVRGGARADRRA
jgi:hypothetical protein